MFSLLLLAALFIVTRKMFEPRTTSRRVILAILAVVGVHLALGYMPATGYQENLIVAVIAFLALGGLASAVHRDVRSGARSLTQTQEDVLSVAIAGLFWLTLVMGVRVLYGSAADSAVAGAVAPYASSAVGNHNYGVGHGRHNAYGHPRLAESGCIPGPGRICVIEEWFY